MDANNANNAIMQTGTTHIIHKEIGKIFFFVAVYFYFGSIGGPAQTLFQRGWLMPWSDLLLCLTLFATAGVYLGVCMNSFGDELTVSSVYHPSGEYH